ncbi:MAG: ACP S-malonyltransferase [Lachnospiraceae bacterium]|nr:ACP S-malonyltransferase [Lachnospiraceae bacterium]
MDKIAFIFPGQGAQYIGMGKDFYEQFEESKKIFDQAKEALGMDLCALCFEENDQLSITEYTQAAMVTTMLAMTAHIHKLGIRPDVTAGLSLGEYAALTECGVLTPLDAIRLVRKRGIFMQEAVPVGKGAMAAVLGLDTEATKKACEETEGIVSIANYNCPGQLVISGEKEAVEKAAEGCKAAGAKRVVPLNVSGPFHSRMLEEAGRKLEKELENITFEDPAIPYVANVTAEYVTKKDGIKESLAKQVSSSVMWQQSVEAMIKDGVTTFVEIGPGKTLSSFVKKIDRNVKVINIDKTDDLAKLEELRECGGKIEC